MQRVAQPPPNHHLRYCRGAFGCRRDAQWWLLTFRHTGPPHWLRQYCDRCCQDVMRYGKVIDRLPVSHGEYTADEINALATAYTQKTLF